MNGQEWFTVTLREWIDGQQRAPMPHRAELLAAVDAGDVPAIRTLMADAPFDKGQRRYLDDLLSRWEAADWHPRDP